MNELEVPNYNFFNLDRSKQYDLSFKRSLEIIEYLKRNNITEPIEKDYISGPVNGPLKELFRLQSSMVKTSIELWSTEEQKRYWMPKLENHSVLVTYGSIAFFMGF